MIHKRWSRTMAAAILTMASISSWAQVNVTTWHNDSARTGVNPQETILTTENVNVGQFGRLFQIQLDGQVYAQPLILSGVEIGGGTHNVAYVATEHDSVYAIDADNGTIYAHVSLIPANGTTVNSSTDLVPSCGDITPEIGITGTPVIDVASNTLYVVAKSKVAGSIVQHLHALNTATLAENFGSPVEIAGSAPGTARDGDGGTVTFNPATEHQRPGLALDKGHVLITWASHCDNGPYHGWMMSYNAQTLAQEAAWNATPNGEPNGTLTLGGIWMSGAAPAIDTNGNIYLATGNGYVNGTTDFGNSVVKLGLPANGTFPVLDYFNPFNQFGSNTIGDQDLGSGGVLLLPTASNGAQLLAQAGKAGNFRLLDRNNLGKNCTLLPTPCTNSDTQIPQELLGAGGLVFVTPSVWNGRVYWVSNGSPIKVYSFDAGNSGLMSTTPISQSAEIFSLRDAASISANNLTNGIYWIMHNTGEIFAYDATDVTRILWRSGQAGGRDANGGATKFAAPTIANGKVYIGNTLNSPNFGSLVAYGLLNGKATIPTFSPGSGTYPGPQTVTISDATPNATFFFTTNGTTPTTASTRYTGPVTVSATETLQAIATANGVDASDVGSATYTITTSTPPVTALPTFSPSAGTYTVAQSVSISDATAGATIRFTTDGSDPTASSALYSGPISVSSTETIRAIAIANGTASAVASATYTINTGGGGNDPSGVNNPNGFPSAAGFTVVNGATVTGGALQLTDGGHNEARAVWSSTKVNIEAFTTDFSFQVTPASPDSSDGMTFTIQNQGLDAHGGIGGALGYGGIQSSVAVKFDLFNNVTEGNDSTGFYSNGDDPTVPSTDLTGKIDLHSGHTMQAHLTYDSMTLTLVLTDTVTGTQFTTSKDMNIPQIVKGTTAFVGFTAGTGGTVATQSILNWTYVPAPPLPVTAAPTFSPVSGQYTQAQTVSISDATAGATIRYTTDGSTPTTSSQLYTGPITVATSQTLRAIAVADGQASSQVASATYVINTGGGTSPPVVNNPSGFPDATGFSLVNGATVTGGALQLTDGGNNEARAIWSSTAVNVQSFTTNFSFQITPVSPNSSDGMTFTIQNQGLDAHGGIGGALGYGGIQSSVAVKFDLFNNQTEGIDSTGFYTGGADPILPSSDMTGQIDLHSGDIMHANLTYDGTTLTLTLTDTVTQRQFTHSEVIDIVKAVGNSNTAFVGFTAGTGGTTSTQRVLNWTYAAN